MTGDFAWPSLYDIATYVNESNHCYPAGCVQLGLGLETPGARRESSSVTAEDDPRPKILLLNTEGLTANKISDIE